MSGTVMTMSSRWSIASAKAELSAVVRKAAREPQVIQNRGEPVAVVLSYDDYQRWRAHEDQRVRFKGFLDASKALRAAGGVVLDIPRRRTRAAGADPFGKR